jgi:hypothetical protein
MERLWLIGPVALLMFWLYSFAVTRTGAIRIIVGAPFMVINAAFNATAGTLIFAEMPRELFFTDRLKRMKESFDPETAEVARLICSEMNKADPGHC